VRWWGGSEACQVKLFSVFKESHAARRSFKIARMYGGREGRKQRTKNLSLLRIGSSRPPPSLPIIQATPTTLPLSAAPPALSHPECHSCYSSSVFHLEAFSIHPHRSMHHSALTSPCGLARDSVALPALPSHFGIAAGVARGPDGAASSALRAQFVFSSEERRALAA
jgi:hypothetical protein